MMRLTGSHRIRSITILLALACGLTVSCGEGDGYTGGNGGPGGTTDKSEPTSHSQSKALLALIRDFPDPQGLVDMYNKYTADDGPSNPARDIGVSFPGTQFLSLVDQLNGIEGPGGKQTSYFSLQDIEAALDTDKSRGITWIYYDLEGDYSPSSEVNDPINAINTAASKVHSRGLKFAFTVVNVGQHPRNIIPHVVSNADGYNPQGQGFITQGTDVYAREVGDVIILAKQANPNILVWAQLSLIKGDVETNKEAFKKLYDYVSERSYTVDGVTVFYGRDSSHLSMLDEFYAWFSSTYR